MTEFDLWWSPNLCLLFISNQYALYNSTFDLMAIMFFGYVSLLCHCYHKVLQHCHASSFQFSHFISRYRLQLCSHVVSNLIDCQHSHISWYYWIDLIVVRMHSQQTNKITANIQSQIHTQSNKVRFVESHHHSHKHCNKQSQNITQPTKHTKHLFLSKSQPNWWNSN